jgi:hypothetical protein
MEEEIECDLLGEDPEKEIPTLDSEKEEELEDWYQNYVKETYGS